MPVHTRSRYSRSTPKQQQKALYRRRSVVEGLLSFKPPLVTLDTMTHANHVPVFNGDAFDCPYCGAYAKQDWLHPRQYIPTHILDGQLHRFRFSSCHKCRDISVWKDERLEYPRTLIAATAHVDMPPEIVQDFDEARSVLAASPRSSAALLRLCVQKLCIALGEKGENINADIGNLVAKGLTPSVQKALDVVRVVGNEQVHPGTLDVRDDPTVALRLFALVNFLVDELISKPKLIAAMYEQLPPTKLEGIQNRDRARDPK